MGDHFLDAAAIGTFLGANRKAVVKSLILAGHRHGPQGDQGLGVDRADILCQEIGLFDRQVGRKEDAQASGLAQPVVDFGQGRGPFDVFQAAIGAAADFELTLRAVDVVIAVTPLVAHPPRLTKGFCAA